MRLTDMCAHGLLGLTAGRLRPRRFVAGKVPDAAAYGLLHCEWRSKDTRLAWRRTWRSSESHQRPRAREVGVGGVRGTPADAAYFGEQYAAEQMALAADSKPQASLF